MLHTSMSQPQNLVLKNFNAYDILVPEKVDLGDNASVSTAVLIDVCDSTNRLENSADLCPDLHGSFLDKVKKSEFDLLDVYQNIYVTPAQITKRDDAKHLSTDNNIEASKIDFTELFEKAEQGKKLSEWTKYDKKVDKQPNLVQNDDEIFDNALSLKCSKLQIEPAPKLEFSEPDPILEDEIDDILQPKRVIDPSVFEAITPICFVKPIIHNSDIPPISSINVNLKGETSTKPTEAFKTVNDIQPLNISNIPLVQLETQKYNHEQKQQVSFTSQDSLMYETKTQFSSKIQPRSNVAPIYGNEIKTSLTDLNSPPVYHLAGQKESVPILHTVKMDSKTYLKRRIVKNDNEKIGYTKGPDIYEKSIVLPQIIKRLAERKQALDEQQNMQRKLILETGEKVNQMKYLVKSNVNQECVAHTKNCFKSQEPKSEASHKAVEHLKLEGLHKQGKPAKVAYLMPEENYAPQASHKSPAYYLEPAKSVSLEPIVMMEDCNKKRIRALNVRVAFEKFVQTGKLPP